MANKKDPQPKRKVQTKKTSIAVKRFPLTEQGHGQQMNDMNQILTFASNRLRITSVIVSSLLTDCQDRKIATV